MKRLKGMVPQLPLVMSMKPYDQQKAGRLTPDSFAEAYAKGMRQTVRFLQAKGASVDLAEELAQSAWARGWEAREQLNFEDRLLPWINTIAFHRLCNDRRQSARLSELPADLLDRRNHDTFTVLDVNLLLTHCSPLEQSLLTDRYVYGREMKEIAASKGLSEIAVRVRIHRCQRLLRTLAQQSGRRVKASVERLLSGLPDGEESQRMQAA